MNPAEAKGSHELTPIDDRRWTIRVCGCPGVQWDHFAEKCLNCGVGVSDLKVRPA